MRKFLLKALSDHTDCIVLGNENPWNEKVNLPGGKKSQGPCVYSVTETVSSYVNSIQ